MATRKSDAPEQPHTREEAEAMAAGDPQRPDASPVGPVVWDVDKTRKQNEEAIAAATS